MPTKEMKFDDLSLEYVDTVAVVRIDRSASANAVRPQTMRELSEVLTMLRSDNAVRAVVLGHRGKHFVAGADWEFLESLKSSTVTRIKDEIYTCFQGAIRQLYQFPKPIVAAIGGAAITVGCEAALACDFRVVTERAAFQESWIRLGLIPPLGGLKKLSALVGYGFAAEMVLRAKSVGGAEAVARGLAHELVAEDALDARAIALAAELGESPAMAYEAAKTGLHRALEQSFDDVFSMSVLNQALLIQSAEFRDALAAAAAKKSARAERR